MTVRQIRSSGKYRRSFLVNSYTRRGFSHLCPCLLTNASSCSSATQMLNAATGRCLHIRPYSDELRDPGGRSWRASVWQRSQVVLRSELSHRLSSSHISWWEQRLWHQLLKCLPFRFSFAPSPGWSPPPCHSPVANQIS